MIDISKFVENKGLTELEIGVFQYIVENIDELSKKGVRGIAKENYTSTSTIMRVAKKLGYAGFLEMQYHLSSLAKSSMTNETTVNDFVSQLSFDTLLINNSKQDIENFVKLLIENKGGLIYIHANGFSSIIAEYMYKKFLVMGIRCIFSNGTDSIGVFENNIENISLAVFISKSGETSTVLKRAVLSKNSGIKVVSFTGEVNSSLSQNSDIAFAIEDNGKLDDRNQLPSTFFPKLMAFVELIVYEFYIYTKQ